MENSKIKFYGGISKELRLSDEEIHQDVSSISQSSSNNSERILRPRIGRTPSKFDENFIFQPIKIGNTAPADQSELAQLNSKFQSNASNLSDLKNKKKDLLSDISKIEENTILVKKNILQLIQKRKNKREEMNSLVDLSSYVGKEINKKKLRKSFEKHVDQKLEMNSQKLLADHVTNAVVHNRIKALDSKLDGLTRSFRHLEEILGDSLSKTTKGDEETTCAVKALAMCRLYSEMVSSNAQTLKSGNEQLSTKISELEKITKRQEETVKEQKQTIADLRAELFCSAPLKEYQLLPKSDAIAANVSVPASFQKSLGEAAVQSLP